MSVHPEFPDLSSKQEEKGVPSEKNIKEKGLMEGLKRVQKQI